MKVIDLLNKIANGEKVPKKFIIKGSCFKDLYFEYNEKYNCYDLIGENFKNGCYVFGYSELNDEIIIIEEEKKIPEKLETYKEVDDEDCYANILKVSKNGEYEIDEAASVIIDKINEIIDYLESKGE